MAKVTKEICVSTNDTMQQALQALDRTGLGVLLVVDEGQRLLGVVTNGDVRRAMLRGRALDCPVAEVMNPSPITLEPGAGTQRVREIIFDKKVEHVPVVDAYGRVLEVMMLKDLASVPLSNPDITDREVAAVVEVMQSPNLSLGPKLVEFEAKVAEVAGRRYGVAVNSGTSGLHLVVRGLDLGPGDEVITTPFSFIASSNCLLYEGAKPVFVDIEPRTYNIDPASIEHAITPRTKAILSVDVFGQPADYAALADIAERHGLRLIVDCCESIGAEFRGRRSSSFGTAGVFGFYPNKQITTGEGGAIVTDDPELAKVCRSMRNQGRGEGTGWLMHERLGYNYRLSDIGCALGVVQLDRLDEILAKRAKVAESYGRLLGGLPGVATPVISPDTTRMSWFVYVVRLEDSFSRDARDRVIQRLSRQGVNTNNYFAPIHLQPFYRKQFGYKEGDFPVTEGVSARTIALPFHNNLDQNTMESVVAHLRAAIADESR